MTSSKDKRTGEQLQIPAVYTGRWDSKVTQLPHFEAPYRGDWCPLPSRDRDSRIGHILPDTHKHNRTS